MPMPTDPKEWAIFALIWAGMPFCFEFFLAMGLTRFVALKAPPVKRATWVAGIAYVVTTIILIFGTGDALPAYLAPIMSAPGAVIVYWLWVRDYRKGWIEDPDNLPEGVTLENDDWQAGLLKLIGLIGAATITVLVRKYMRGEL